MKFYKVIGKSLAIGLVMVMFTGFKSPDSMNKEVAFFGSGLCCQGVGTCVHSNGTVFADSWWLANESTCTGNETLE